MGRRACLFPCRGDLHWRTAPMPCLHLWMQDIEPLLDSQGNPVTDSRGNPIPKVLPSVAGAPSHPVSDVLLN